MKKDNPFYEIIKLIKKKDYLTAFDMMGVAIYFCGVFDRPMPVDEIREILKELNLK